MRQNFDAMAKLLSAARADATTTKYYNSLLKWKKWAVSQGLCESDIFPAKSIHVAIYLTCLAQTHSSLGSLNDAYYGIRWAHFTVVIKSPTDDSIVCNILEGAKRLMSKPICKKEPISQSDLLQMFNKHFDESNLYSQRIISMCLLAYAGFLRSKELINIRRSDVNIFKDYMEIFIESSKTDIYRDGVKVVLARLDSPLCPVSNFERYCNLAIISAHSDEYVFRALSKTGNGYKLRSVNKPLTYTRVREVFLQAFDGIVPDIRRYGLHSLRSGGATASVSHGIPDRMFKRHGRWRSESAKDGYVKDSLDDRLFVSKNLGL
ncbi:hypothetical protein FSP39_007771 [Pinctada imbricata]|uniref:Tyr recombinase domain-containing protein n=1 Tax=Pinctada imbricata TaxID=66713 RepID=A0AA88XLK4_PINIB|nr:hypothetical protein FSP39_007771 [Pinctada imbricata]